MKKQQPKRKDLPLDELIGQFVRFAERIEKVGGEVTFRMDFRPKQKPPVLTTT